MDPELADIVKESPRGDLGSDAESSERYRARFRALRRNQILATFVFYGGAASLLVALPAATQAGLFAPAGLGPLIILGTLVFALGGAGFMILNWHCPRCGRYLAQAKSLHLLFLPEVTIHRCPHCGLRLNSMAP